MSKARRAATVVALTTIVLELDSRGVPPGTLVTIKDPAEAERLVQMKRAAWPEAPPRMEPQEPVKPEGEALTEAIVAAIKALDLGDEENRTAAGKPQVSALELALGYEITAADRDAAWAVVQAEGESAASADERLV